MLTQVSVEPVHGLPPLGGAHELAWSYLLDEIVADAFHSRLAAVHFTVPSAALWDEVQMRVRPNPLAAGIGAGAALLAPGQQPPDDARRLYTLALGVLAPPHLRTHRQDPDMDGWVLERQLSVFTWAARGLGLAIRLATLLESPHLADRASLAMRRTFVNVRVVPAYYHLRIWKAA